MVHKTENTVHTYIYARTHSHLWTSMEQCHGQSTVIMTVLTAHFAMFLRRWNPRTAGCISIYLHWKVLVNCANKFVERSWRILELLKFFNSNSLLIDGVDTHRERYELCSPLDCGMFALLPYYTISKKRAFLSIANLSMANTKNAVFDGFFNLSALICLSSFFSLSIFAI